MKGDDMSTKDVVTEKYQLPDVFEFRMVTPKGQTVDVCLDLSGRFLFAPHERETPILGLMKSPAVKGYTHCLGWSLPVEVLEGLKLHLRALGKLLKAYDRIPQSPYKPEEDWDAWRRAEAEEIPKSVGIDYLLAYCKNQPLEPVPEEDEASP